MDDNTPTHFNVLIAGTGLAESILAASLSKSGYSVLQLDSASYYGTEHASLSLTELDEWLKQQPDGYSSAPSTPLDPDLLKLSQRFALSLSPVLLRATGPGIDLLVRSKVATYLQFGLLGGVGLCKSDETEGEGKSKARVERVPASKADVFNDQTLSLVEKRRLTKLLLFAAGQESLEEDKVLVAQPDIAFFEYLKKAYNLSGTVAESLTYALALCSSSTDPALGALRRLRSIIHSVGRYGPSPYLVGHYGGAGDLVGGFSRICAVWGGGQILGRPLAPLELSPPTGTPVPASQPSFMVHENPPPPPSNPSDDRETPRSLGIPVQLEEGEAPTMFTGDWVISSPHLLSTLFPSSDSTPSRRTPTSVNLLAILREPIPFPPPQSSGEGEEEETPASLSDSNLFVFPPSGDPEVKIGTVTALQLGKGTMSCPDGYHVLYLSAPLLSRSSPPTKSPETYLTSYLDSLISLCPVDTPRPLYTASYFLSTPPSQPSSTPPSQPSTTPIPANLLVTPTLPSVGKTEGLITALDEVVEVAETMFWKIVGDEGKAEGVEFFRKEVVNDDDDE
ncbi:uncharacterized protein JCM6883_006958 [Sporobolomyces salmoneus]|uniref:uncharacterized protein n=1 Tax=Sporobolomyces salmoneus TaxID=183962 RepID=UPI00317179C6